MFFDDYPLEEENLIFSAQLRSTFRGTDIELFEEKTIPHLEVSLKMRDYVAIILDVMSAFPEAPELGAMAGIEILKRCRAGYYGQSNSQALVFMRTARGELHVKELAFNLGCTDYFRVGSQDDKLLDTLVTRLLRT